MTSVNDAPVAYGDVVTVLEDDSAGVTFDVLANDTDADSGDTLSVASYDGSTVANGTLTDNGGGSFTYVPDAGFSGSEMFSYAAKDTSGATVSAIVTISVTAMQHDPVAGNDAYATQQDTEVIVAAPGILGNDGDADGDAITLDTTPVAWTQHGLASIAADGTFKYAAGLRLHRHRLAHVSDQRRDRAHRGRNRHDHCQRREPRHRYVLLHEQRADTRHLEHVPLTACGCGATGGLRRRRQPGIDDTQQRRPR